MSVLILPENDQPPVRAIPTQGDLEAAHTASYEAFERFDADPSAENREAYMWAINRAADLRCQRFHAILMGEV